ncbi:MAG: FG-GAP-like repeat-containing protein [bacterium]
MPFLPPRALRVLRSGLVHLLPLILVAALATPARARVWRFEDFTTEAGIVYSHGYVGGVLTAMRDFAGGVAAGDYDNDGYVDFYAVRGNIGRNLLYRNLRDGRFEERAIAAGIGITGAQGCGPVFADYDGDGWLDLLIGGFEGTAPRLFRNQGNGTFTDVTVASGITYTGNSVSSAFGDYDRDGDLDLFMTHWGAPQFTRGHLWRNNGNGTFTSADSLAGFDAFGDDLIEYTWSANFADINNDDWPDLLVCSDFEHSEIYLNDGDGTFTCVTTGIISDENGMGSAVADYDADGDLDWFVASIWDPDGIPDPTWGASGNRLYQNQGAGTFADVTTAAGVRQGYWGWGSSFADFNNDGSLDLFHVNGAHLAPPFVADPSRLFVSNGNGTFSEMGASLGVADTGQGRGVSCFDIERDGDLDIFVANNSQAPILYRNEGGNAGRWITIKLVGLSPNTQAIGARVLVTAGGVTQMRELRAGTNYVSQDPAEAHFGIGSATTVSEVRIEWPNGQVDIHNGLAPNYFLVFDQSGMTSVPSAVGGNLAAGLISLGPVAPNPVGGSTTIEFRIAETAPVSLRLFDASGRAVRTLLDEVRAAGAHTVGWDGRDAAERDVPAGLYFYRVESLGTAESGKLVVLR